jgi:hypothetical protein
VDEKGVRQMIDQWNKEHPDGDGPLKQELFARLFSFRCAQPTKYNLFRNLNFRQLRQLRLTHLAF